MTADNSDIDFKWLAGLAARLRRQGHTDGCVVGADAIDMLCEHTRTLEAEIDRLQAAAGMTRYWNDQYDLVSARLQRVNDALNSPYTAKKHPLTAVVDRTDLDVKRHEWSETPVPRS